MLDFRCCPLLALTVHPMEGLERFGRPAVCVVGSVNFDQVIRAPLLPKPGETRQGSRYETGYGGKGANQAVMAARLGSIVTLVAAVGDDAIGKASLGHYRREGIDTRFIKMTSEAASGVASIWVDERSGQNQIVVVPGANDRLTPTDLEEAEGVIQLTKVVVCQNEIPQATNAAAFRLARAGGALTIYNPAPAREIDPTFFALCDVIVPNQYEAALLTRSPTATDEGVREAAARLRRKGVGSVIITLGERGAYLLDSDGEHWVESRPVQPVDTTGAGDAFVGALAQRLAEGRPPLQAAKTAGRIAALTVLRPGAQSAYPSREEALAFCV